MTQHWKKYEHWNIPSKIPGDVANLDCDKELEPFCDIFEDSTLAPTPRGVVVQNRQKYPVQQWQVVRGQCVASPAKFLEYFIRGNLASQ